MNQATKYMYVILSAALGGLRGEEPCNPDGEEMVFDYVLVDSGSMNIIYTGTKSCAEMVLGCDGQSWQCAKAYLEGNANDASFRIPSMDLLKDN